MKVRPLAPPEWELKRALRLAALKDSPKAFLSTLEREAGYSEADWRAWPKNGVYLAAFDDDERPLGIAAGYRELSSTAVVRLISMWVTPQARGLGIAGRLTSAVIAWAKEQRVELVELQVAPGNDLAMRAYLRSGFILTDRKPSGSCAAILEFPLSRFTN